MPIQISQQQFWIFLLISLWVIPWKGYALWKAARRKDKWWFIALLLINSLAILEAVYIFYISERKTVEKS